MATYMPGGYITRQTATTGTAATWHQWINTTTGNFVVNPAVIATTTGRTSNDVWERWREVGYTTLTNYTWQQEVWGQWEDDERTEEERRREHDELQARREQQSRERLAREQALMENRRVAGERALELLDLVVAEEDRIPDLDLLLQIRGSDGDLYRLEMHRETVHGNIVRVDEHGCILGRACVAPTMYDREGALPTADGWVGQYLGLKFDTEEFLAHANWSHQQPCRHPAEQEQVAA